MYHTRTSNITHQIYHLQSSKKQTPILWSSNFSRCWFQTFFIFHPYLGEMIQFDEYFSNGLVQPPTSSAHVFFSTFFYLTTSVMIPRRLQLLALSSWRWGSLSDQKNDRDPFGASRRFGFLGWFKQHFQVNHLGVSLNGGTPKSSILIGISIINHPFWGTTILIGNTHLLKLWGNYSTKSKTSTWRWIYWYVFFLRLTIIFKNWYQLRNYKHMYVCKYIYICTYLNCQPEVRWRKITKP